MAVPKRRISYSKVKLGYKKRYLTIFHNRKLNFYKMDIKKIMNDYSKLMLISKRWIKYN
jgi:hypothetical protein